MKSRRRDTGFTECIFIRENISRKLVIEIRTTSCNHV